MTSEVNDWRIVRLPSRSRMITALSCPGLSRASTFSAACNKDVDGRDEPGHDERWVRSLEEKSYFAATTMISTLYCGAASLASTVARAGVLPADTQPSHTAFISGKVFMSVM